MSGKPRAATAAAVIACAAAVIAAPSAAPPTTQVIRLPGRPFVGSIAAGYGSIWIASHVGPAVFRVDPRTNRIIKRIQVGENQCVGPAVGAGAVWEPNCWGETGHGIVYKISARTNRVVARIDGEGAAFGDGSLWTVSDDTAALLRIDPRSKVVLARIRLPIAPPRYWFPGGVCYGALWAVADTTVVRFDTATNKATAVIQLPNATSAAARSNGYFSANWVACAAGKVWVPNLAGLYAIDPPTDTAHLVPIRITPMSRLGGAGLTSATGSVFVRSSDRTVTQLDARGEKVVHIYAAGGGGGGQITVAFGSLWVPNAFLGAVWRERLR